MLRLFILLYFHPPHDAERRHFISLAERVVEHDLADRFEIEADAFARALNFHVYKIHISGHARHAEVMFDLFARALRVCGG